MLPCLPAGRLSRQGSQRLSEGAGPLGQRQGTWVLTTIAGARGSSFGVFFAIVPWAPVPRGWDREGRSHLHTGLLSGGRLSGCPPRLSSADMHGKPVTASVHRDTQTPECTRENFLPTHSFTNTTYDCSLTIGLRGAVCFIVYVSPRPPGSNGHQLGCS